MPQTLTAQVVQAFNRFGLGARPTDAVPADPVAWLTAQLAGPDPLAAARPSLGSALSYVAAINAATPHSAQRTAAEAALAKLNTNQQASSVTQAIASATPFRERLVRFWANHFAVQSGASMIATATAGCFVNQAIRPYVNDTFANMLLAVMQHPAMLSALNADVSIGPQSPRGLATGAGLNENLGRETLELFTVGLAANYTQADVDALACMLTGWTVSTTPPSQGFVIDSNAHQPGPQTLLGVTYPGTVFDAFEALQYLGTHPLTYAHIATKLVTHFCSDTPDPADVATITTALSNSGGSLVAAANALVGLDSAWVPQVKLRTPADYIIAGMRALGAAGGAAPAAVTYMAELGEPIWAPPFPNGWSDLGADWASPSQMMLRTNWANTFCNGYLHADPGATVQTALGPLISPATTAMLARVSATHDKLTILFCSPEFQRR